MTRMTLKKFSLASVAVVAVAGLAACGGTDSVGGGGDGSIKSLEIVVPADPGGGWDQTGRAMAEVLDSEGIVDSTKVTNTPGAGGTTGLASLASASDPNTLMVTGYVMVGAVELNKSSVSLADVTPIARLTEEQEVIVVPADSPYETLDDLLADVEANGKDVAIAGGSAGGADHILAGLVFQAAGLSPDDLNYVPYDGGGETVAALLGNKVAAGISGAGEYREQVIAGELRALAVSGDEAVEGYDGVLPLTEQGVDVNLTNWRGVVAPGNVTDEERDRLTEVVTEMHDSDAWAGVLTENDWADAWMTGDEYETFVADETDTVQAILKDIGLIS